MSVKRRDVAMVSNEYEDYSDSVLYDVFYEAGTMLGGWLSSAQDKAEAEGNDALARQFFAEQLNLNRERAGVDAHDRVAQIEKIKKWHTRRAELSTKQIPIAV